MLRVAFSVDREPCIVCECSRCGQDNRFAIGTALAHPVACVNCGHQADISQQALGVMRLPTHMAGRCTIPRPCAADDPALP